MLEKIAVLGQNKTDLSVQSQTEITHVIDNHIKFRRAYLTTDWNSTYKYLCGDKTLIE
jgi:hypothetical protein